MTMVKRLNLGGRSTSWRFMQLNLVWSKIKMTGLVFEIEN